MVVWRAGGALRVDAWGFGGAQAHSLFVERAPGAKRATLLSGTISSRRA